MFDGITLCAANQSLYSCVCGQPELTQVNIDFSVHGASLNTGHGYDLCCHSLVAMLPHQYLCSAPAQSRQGI